MSERASGKMSLVVEYEQADAFAGHLQYFQGLTLFYASAKEMTLGKITWRETCTCVIGFQTKLGQFQYQLVKHRLLLSDRFMNRSLANHIPFVSIKRVIRSPSSTSTPSAIVLQSVWQSKFFSSVVALRSIYRNTLNLNPTTIFCSQNLLLKAKKVRRLNLLPKWVQFVPNELLCQSLRQKTLQLRSL